MSFILGTYVTLAELVRQQRPLGHHVLVRQPSDFDVNILLQIEL
jgi:hypothetical protein